MRADVDPRHNILRLTLWGQKTQTPLFPAFIAASHLGFPPLDFTSEMTHREAILAIMTMEDGLMDWKMLLACITGSVEDELLLRNEYLATENRILRHQIEGRVTLTDAERQTLAEIGKKLGKQDLEEIATIVKPDTILAWHRKLVAQKSR